MFRSLRARLLVWYTAMLAIVITAFGVLVCFDAWRTRIADIDAGLRARANQMAAALRPAGDGRFDLVLPADPVAADDDARRPYYAVWDAAGRLIDRSDPDLELTAPGEPGARTAAGRREVAVRTAAGPLIVAGRDLADVRADVQDLAASMAAVGAAALLVSLAGGWVLVGRALAPVDRIGRTARRMSDGDFTARIPLDRVETELEQLGGAINDAFAKLSDSIEQERRFTADASHELRTPLATLLTETQTILARRRETEEYRASLEVCRRAADRMRVVVERLLLLARADAGELRMAMAPLRLDDLLQRVAEDVKPLASARDVTLALDVRPVSVRGDADRLTDAITNLVTNAIDYNVPNGRVDIRVAARNGQAEVRIADTGIGIDAADVPNIFNRFYRADPARARVRGGAGLGLAVARWIIERHDGQIVCTSEPGKGSVFTVALAAAPDAGPGAR
jgi:two-component system OmpR family sensor kinase